MVTTIGVSGTAVRDHYFDPSRLTRCNGGYALATAAGEFEIVLSPGGSGNGKPEACFDRGVLVYADEKRYGGGGYNSAVAMRRADPDVGIQYSDSGVYDAALAADLASHNIEYRARGLHAMSENLVTGDPERPDKLVFKSARPKLAGVGPDDQFSWLAGAGTVLANSDKDRAWVTRLSGRAARGCLNLHFVVTGALPADYLMEAVIPSATVVFAGLDEIGESLGIQIEESIEGGISAVRLLAVSARSPSAHVTMGSQGVLVSDPETMTVLHVRLAPGRVAEEVRRIVRRDRARVCGCGDSYAGGASASIAGQNGGTALWPHPSGAAAAAMAGSAAALAALGYRGALTPKDFVVSEVGEISDSGADTPFGPVPEGPRAFWRRDPGGLAAAASR
jgi:hypothetical protein